MVLIPKVKPIQASRGPGVGRINQKAQDSSASILGRTGAIGDIAETAVAVKTKYENEEIENVSYDVGKQIREYDAVELGKINAQLKDGNTDPSKAYLDYGAARESKVKEIFSQYENLNERVTRGVTSNFAKLEDSQRLAMMNQRGKHKATYKHTVFRNGVKVNKQDMSLHASSVRPDDESSYFMYQQDVHDLRTSYAKRGIDNGSVEVLEEDDKRTPTHSYKDADGNTVRTVFNKNAIFGMTKELDEGHTSAIENLIDSGHPNKAQALFEKYKKAIHPDNQAKLSKDFKKNEEDNTATELFNEIGNKPLSERRTAVAGIKNPTDRANVTKLLAADAQKRKILRVEEENANYEMVANTAINMRKAGTLHGIADLEKTLQYKKGFDKMSSTQKKSIAQSFNAPSKTDSGAMLKWQELANGSNSQFTVETMSEAKYNEFLIDLSDADRSKAWTYYRKQNQVKPETAAARNSFNSNNLSFYKEMLLSKGMIENADHHSGLTNDSKDNLARGNQELRVLLDGYPVNSSPDKMKEAITKFVNGQINSDIYDDGGTGWTVKTQYKPQDLPPRTVSNNTGRKTLAKSNKPSSLEGLDAKNVSRYQSIYKHRNGLSTKPDVNDQAFLNFVDGQRKRRGNR